jgi:hypothetical protein
VGAGQKLSKLCDLVLKGFGEAGLLLKVGVSSQGGGGGGVMHTAVAVCW